LLTVRWLNRLTW